MKKLTAIASAVMLFALTTHLASAGSLFGDVDSSTYYQGGIEFLAEEGIINGYPDGTYKPNQTLNRAEMLKIIAEGAKIYYNWAPEVFQAYEDDKCFSDVPAGQWYTKYVCYGKDQGWVIGYSDGTFKPTQTVTFVEGLKMTFKGFGLGYTETSQPWYKDSVEAAGEKNYIPPTISAFAAGFKRGEMADMIARIIKDNEDTLEEYLGERAELNATYATIEAGLDVSTMEVEELTVEDEVSEAENSEDEVSEVENPENEEPVAKEEDEIEIVEEIATEDPPADPPDTKYANGNYTESGNYVSPAGSEQIDIELTLENDVVTSLTVTPRAGNSTSQAFQLAFIDGINVKVVGKNLDEIGAIGKTNGSSLTPNGFNQALEVIKSEATPQI